jgi:hypothetical protein
MQVVLVQHPLQVCAHGAITANDKAELRKLPTELRDDGHLQIDAFPVHEPAQHHNPALSETLVCQNEKT